MITEGGKSMKKLSVAIILCLAWTGLARAHTSIEGLPDPVVIMSYRQVLYLNPDDLETRNKLAMAFYRTNKLEEAQNELQYVLKKDPKNFNALDGFGVVLIRMNKHKDALDYLTKAAGLNEKDAMVHVHLSVVYDKMKDKGKAQAEWQKAQSLASPEEAKKIEKEWKLVSGR
jgi:Flp pilus assembly protein TadD